MRIARPRALVEPGRQSLRTLAYQPYLAKAGGADPAQAGPLAGSADAAKLCAKIKAAGADCIPKRPVN